MTGSVATPHPGESQPPAGAAEQLIATPSLLGPAETFPENLEDLPLAQVQILHSRLTRQLDREHLSPEGPHPVTLERHHQLTIELDYRDLTAG